MKRTLLFISLVSAQLCAHAAGSEEQRWAFDVFLDQQKIGYHTFVVSQDGDSKLVEIDAAFDVKVLFFNAYSYKHSNSERWQGDCLLTLQSETDDNGDQLAVTGSTQNDQFVVTAKGSEANVDACPMSFAYWNPAFLKASELINAQTGQLTPVKIQPTGSESLTVAGATVTADTYTVQLEDQLIRLWYAADDYRWLALETPARGNRVLRYQATSLPVSIAKSSLTVEQEHAMAY